MNLQWEDFKLAKDATVITTVDAHTAGEPLRIITGGLPELKGNTILERRRYMLENLDHIRRALMWEPRGHYNMYGCMITEPVSPDADIGVLFMHNEGYSTMCGHGVIALVTVLLETSAFPAKGQHTPVNLDTPAGLVRAMAHLTKEGHVERVSFLNVPSFLYARDIELFIPEYGDITVDIAFGGAFYAFLPAKQVSLNIAPEQANNLALAGNRITTAVNQALSVKHPLEEDLGFLYGTIFTDLPESPEHYSRNACIFADAEVDRSPTGTGVSARLALHHAKGEISDGQEIVIESILGSASTFSGKIVGRAQVGKFDAIIPEVSGKASITGKHSFIIDKQDELGRGFLLS